MVYVKVGESISMNWVIFFLSKHKKDVYITKEKKSVCVRVCESRKHMKIYYVFLSCI